MAKKIMSAFIAVMLVICASAIPAFAADGASAYVSISPMPTATVRSR